MKGICPRCAFSLDQEYRPRPVKGEVRQRMEQAEERRARIRGALYLGYSLTEIAQSLGISRQRVHQILRGHAACDRVINWLRHE